ncbi:O-linked N-acetylglucosamine transferase, SPINDLY family protein [Scytonema sp. UIC 10036]|uniref:O-linked N-acetylglucosamine transferase, SPINDLY family protein n=1 Tax=Scytonema sp. UIC 10036 TaxID=2304196 RepID=UPI0012DA8CAC|nr:O-linked N-acetylglucosamine transferase, SPINDLY family protein [Scytonema sp. UIC 10036]MUG97014.1 O-linked N-acetylglucosamine transferase, SPINDLY family protein [Scytonema sp. UIC 10036]
MTFDSLLINSTDWQQQAYKSLIQEDYYKAVSFYEQAIAVEPERKSHYWYLGLVLLLQGQMEEAQATWLMAMIDGEPEQVDEWNEELIQVLQAEAQRRSARADYFTALAIREQIRCAQPAALDNLLHLIQLAIQLETFTGDELHTLEVIELLRTEQSLSVDAKWLLQVLEDVIDSAPLHPSTQEFAEVCLVHVQHLPNALGVLLLAAIKIAATLQQGKVAVRLAELCLRINSSHTELLRHLSSLYQNIGDYDQGIEMARRCYALSKTLADEVFANHLVLRGLMHAGGRWEEASLVLQKQQSLLATLLEEQPTDLSQTTVVRLFGSSYFFPYFRDRPQENRKIYNQVAQLCQTNIENYAKEHIERYYQRSKVSSNVGKSTKSLKIGYISQCMRRHSVGWLARWLFQHHDRDRFQIHGYFVAANAYQIGSNQREDSLHEWYINQVDKANLLGIDTLEIAEKIYQDEIDILVDLDSLTLNITCEVMALKPASVQVSWLGWDASGVPTIDYYIADPYVLPDAAKQYYSEKIWRLPKTYIAVDGFEVGVPTLRRDDLDIPCDAVIYLSSQGGYKRHPETARWQMRILKAVPNSYFLIKGSADQKSMKSFFEQIAEEEGVDFSRLRFLPDVATEAVHRANLGIADVVLDTYPYNGATTTMETLWMGIPLVTRVGEQFAARNSYTMMMNAGITEGIAWTDEDYVEWGRRLGKDEVLRQKIASKLKASRQTAPLWNAKQFTREMEKAYEQMWQKYVEGGG